MRKKKDVVYGLLLLHDLADLRFTNPIRNPYPRHKYCTKLKMYILRTPVVPQFAKLKISKKISLGTSEPVITCLKRDSQYEESIWVDATDQTICNSGLLIWLLVTKDRLRCFVRHNQHQKSTFKSSRVAIKSSDILHQIDPRLMRLSIFEFRTAICVNIWLVYGQKAKTCKFTMVIAWRKHAGAKRYFRHES